MGMKMEELKSICEQVIVLAQNVGKWIASERLTFSPEHVEVKGEHDFVSYVDKKAEKIILQTLQELLPSAGVISEEGGGTAHLNGLNWVVDPLDGTTNFIHSMPPYAVSIGLVDGNDAILGVIYEIGLRETFHAVKGAGAFKDGTPIHCSPCQHVEEALVATGFPYSNYSRLEQFFKTMDHFMRHSHGMRRLGSAATDLAWLACGRVDAFYEYGLKPWDVAAGIAICQEAGVLLSDFSGGNNILYGGEILCASARCFREFQEIIVRTMGIK